jgi:hypothetical protein
MAPARGGRKLPPAVIVAGTGVAAVAAYLLYKHWNTSQQSPAANTSTVTQGQPSPLSPLTWLRSPQPQPPRTFPPSPPSPGPPDKGPPRARGVRPRRKTAGSGPRPSSPAMHLLAYVASAPAAGNPAAGAGIPVAQFPARHAAPPARRAVPSRAVRSYPALAQYEQSILNRDQMIVSGNLARRLSRRRPAHRPVPWEAWLGQQAARRAGSYRRPARRATHRQIL